MKRTRPLLMTLSILTGLVVGFGGRGALTPPINRPAEMVALFETYCLPLKTGNAVVLPEGRRFEWARLLPGEQRWIDHVSLTHIIVRDPRSCTVSDRPKWLTKAEQDELERLVADMVAEHLPELSSDPKAELANWDLSRAWLAGRPWIDRWGVQLSSSGSDGGDHTTTLRFVAPPKSKVEGRNRRVGKHPGRGGRQPRRASSCCKHHLGMTAPHAAATWPKLGASYRGFPGHAGTKRGDTRSGSPPYGSAAAMRGSEL